MKNQLISFETARLAKEKEFNVTCRSMYNKSGKSFYEKEGWYWGAPNQFVAPTQSLLQRWLREKHTLIVYCLPKITPTNDFVWYTNFNIKESKKSWANCYSTYEDALEVALLEALKLIKL